MDLRRRPHGDDQLPRAGRPGRSPWKPGRPGHTHRFRDYSQCGRHRRRLRLEYQALDSHYGRKRITRRWKSACHLEHRWYCSGLLHPSFLVFYRKGCIEPRKRDHHQYSGFRRGRSTGAHSDSFPNALPHTVAYALSHTHADTVPNAYADAFALSHTHADTFSDAYAHAFADADSDSDSFPNALAHADPLPFSHPHTDTFPNAVPYTHADTVPSAYADSFSDTHALPHGHTDPNAYTHAVSHTHADASPGNTTFGHPLGARDRDPISGRPSGCYRG